MTSRIEIDDSLSEAQKQSREIFKQGVLLARTAQYKEALEKLEEAIQKDSTFPRLNQYSLELISTGCILKKRTHMQD